MPSRPSSSPIIAKMKSVWASGRLPHFSRLAPRPSAPPAAGGQRVQAVQRPASRRRLVALAGPGSTGSGAAGAELVTDMTAISPSAPHAQRRRTAAAGRPRRTAAPPTIAIRTSAVPRSPPSEHQARSRAEATGSSGTSRWRHWSSSRCLRASRSAPQSTRASLAASRRLHAERPAEVDPVRVAVDATPTPGDQHQAAAGRWRRPRPDRPGAASSHGRDPARRHHQAGRPTRDPDGLLLDDRERRRRCRRRPSTLDARQHHDQARARAAGPSPRAPGSTAASGRSSRRDTGPQRGRQVEARALGTRLRGRRAVRRDAAGWGAHA